MTLKEKQILEEMSRHPDKVIITPAANGHGYNMRDLTTGKVVSNIPGVTEKIQKGLHQGKGMTPTDAGGQLAVELTQAKGTRVHKEVQEWITYGFKPTSKEARSLVDRLNAMYPASQGWELKSEVPVADFKGYASSIDVLAINKKTNQSSIIDLKTGSRHDANYTAQVTMYRKMLQSTYGIKANTANIMYSATNKRAFTSIYEIGGKSGHGWMKDKDLSEIMYGTGLIHRRVSSQDEIDIKRAQLSAAHASQYFKPYTPDVGKWSGPLNVLDIETGGQREPVSVGVLKLRRNLTTGELHLEDTYERYYYPNTIAGAKWQEAVNVHGLTPGVISKLRGQQALKYGNKFNDTERLALLNFLKEGRVITQKGTEFDLPVLFGEDGSRLSQFGISSTDILIAGEHKFGRGHASLEKMSQQLFGKSMAELGLSHHNAMDDIIHTALIYDAIIKAGGIEGESMRWLEDNLGFNLAPYEPVLKSMVVQGKYNNFEIGDYVDMSKKRIVVHKKPGSEEYTASIAEIAEIAKGYDAEGNNTGFGYEEAPYLDAVNTTISDQQLLSESVMSTWSAQFAHLSESLENIATTTREWASAAEISGRATARRSAINAMKGFTEGTPEWNAQKADVMEAYGITGDKWHQVSAGVAAANRAEWLKERTSYIDQTKEFRKQGFMSGKEFEKFTEAASDATKANDDLSDSLGKVAGRAAAFKNIVGQLWSERLYDPQGYANVVSGQLSGINKAWSSILPSWLRGPAAATASGYISQIQSQVAMRSYGVGIANKAGGMVGGGLMAAGAASGNPWVAGAGALVWGGTALVSQIVGKYKEAKAKQIGERIQEAGYGIQAWWGILTAPFQALVKAIKLLAAGVVGLIGIAKGVIKSGFGSLSSFGNPVTNLSGLGFEAYQKTHIWDYLAGSSKGSYFSGVIGSANAVQQLYSVGQYDQQRLIAASMLGVFEDLYTPGRSGSQMQESTVNKLLQRLRASSSEQDRARTMSLAGMIDPNLPALLDSLYYGEYNNLGEVRKGTGVWDFGFRDGERRRMERARASYGHSMEVWDTVKIRAAVTLWEVAGRNVMNYVNAFGNAIATRNWKEASRMFHKALSELWTGIKRIVYGDENKSFSDILKETGEKLWSAIKPLMPQIISIATEVAVNITKMFWELVKGIWGVIGPFMGYLSTARFSSVAELAAGKPLIQFGGDVDANGPYDYTDVPKDRILVNKGSHYTGYFNKDDEAGWASYFPFSGLSRLAEQSTGLVYKLEDGSYFPLNTAEDVDTLRTILSLKKTADKNKWSSWQYGSVVGVHTGNYDFSRKYDPMPKMFDMLRDQSVQGIQLIGNEAYIHMLIETKDDKGITRTTTVVPMGSSVAIPVTAEQTSSGIRVRTGNTQTESN